jgi:hypothetical protein
MKRAGTVVYIIGLIFLFAQDGQAQSFLENEAGISASCRLTTVNLTQAVTAYKNIEYQTAEYIIGSVAITNYPESDDVHVYLNTSGDMIAYYFKTEKVAKIIDWVAYYTTPVFTGSKLETALTNVANVMGQNPTNIKYYDFRYPQANNLKIVLEEARNVTETFRLQIPSSYIIYNRSYSHAIRAINPSNAGQGTLSIDGVTLSTFSVSNPNWKIVEGEITPTQLSPDLSHTVSLQQDNEGYGYVAIILLYTEP